MFEQGLGLFQQGRFAEAEDFVAQYCESSPGEFRAWFLLGAIRDRQGKYGDALTAFERAVELNPHHLEAITAQAAMLSRLGRPREALAVYARLKAMDPANAQTHVNLGILLEEVGDPSAALTAYDAALAIDARQVSAWMNRGSVLTRLQRPDEALENNQRLVAAYPDLDHAHFNLAEVCLALDRYEEALAACDRALELNPDYAKAHADRGLALAALGRFDEAEAAWQRAAAISPRELVGFFQGITLNPDGSAPAIDARVIYAQKWMARQAECNWADRDAFVRVFQALLRTQEPPLTDRALLYQSLFLPVDPAARYAYACRVSDHIQNAVQASGIRFQHPTSHAKERLRLGYVSPDFREHTVSHLIRRLFGLHDRSRVEVYAYSLHKGDGSPQRREIETTSDRFIDLTEMDDTAAAQRIHNDGIDILIDLAGYTTHSRTEIFALRPAPLQLSWLGYPGSLGAKFIDYCIVDPIVTPPGNAGLFREKLAYMPHSYYLYNNQQPIAEMVGGRAGQGLPASGVVFCCFNQVLKIEPAIFSLWMRLLSRVDGSVLWLTDPGAKARKNLQGEAKTRGVASARLVFAPRVATETYLGRYRFADLFLDTLLYNAHTTAADTLWAGLPVLTCPGQDFAGRVAASVVSAAGLPEMIVADLAEYEERAVFLATHRDELAALRAKLEKHRLRCAMFDTEGFVQHLEAAYEAMWACAASGTAPTSFSLPRRDSHQNF